MDLVLRRGIEIPKIKQTSFVHRPKPETAPSAPRCSASAVGCLLLLPPPVATKARRSGSFQGNNRRPSSGGSKRTFLLPARWPLIVSLK